MSGGGATLLEPLNAAQRARLVAAMSEVGRLLTAAHGRDVLRLDTNKALSAAIGLYHSCGFEEVAAFSDEPYARHRFEKRIAEPAQG